MIEDYGRFIWIFYSGIGTFAGSEIQGIQIAMQSHPERGCRAYRAWLDHHPQVWEWYSGQSFAFHFSSLAEGGGSDWCHQWCASRTSPFPLSDEKGGEEGTENTSY